MRKLLLFFTMLMVAALSTYAQNRTLTGVVTGEGETDPLVGVTIAVKGSTIATSSDINGKFSLKITNLQNVVITAKFIGFQYQEFTVPPGQTVLNIKLPKSTHDLAEVAVVAVGYGTLQKNKVLGSVTEIKAADIEDIPVANLGTALMNRLAGVGVSVASGKPGATTTITLQGAYSASAGSLGTTTDPLFIIDGLRAQKSDFDNLDASLIESISFLKDAQAAIYGAEADKGVVLVTTKKGKAGKPQISYSGYFSTSNNAFTPKLLTGLQEATGINDYLTATNAASTSMFSQADLNFIASNPYPSWYSQLWHSSQTKRHTINVSGGTDRVTFFGGASYYDEGGNFGLTEIKKYNIRSGMTAKVTDDVTAFISLNAGYEYDDRNTAKSENNDTENNTTTALTLTPAWIPLTTNGLPNYLTLPSASGGTWNPLAFFGSNSYVTNTNQSINLNSSIDFHPHQIKGLSAKVQFGKNIYLGNSKNYYPSYQTYQFASTGQNGALYTNTLTAPKTVASANQILAGTSSTNEYELIGSLNYNRSIKKNNFDLLFVATQNETSSTSYNVYRTNQQIPGIDQFFAFDPSTTTQQNPQNSENGNLGYVARLNYDYAGKYLFQLIDRIDGSSNFAPGNRFGSSPAAAIGWRVSEEDFYKQYVSKYMSSFKIRYNIGITGDDRVSPFLYEPRFTTYSGTALFGSTITNGLDPSYVPNPGLTWEHNRAQTLGFDAGFFNDRLTVTAEIWNKHYYDGLVDLSTAQTPWTFGLASGVINYNQANTWGESVTINYVGNINKDWQFNANVNFGWGDSQTTQGVYNPANLGISNEYASITNGELASQYSSTNIGLIAKGIIRTQAQLDAILAKNPNYTIEGKTPQVGWMDFVDVNGDGKITAAADEGPMYSSITPALSMGWTWGLAYKTFRMSVNGYFQLGGKITTAERTPPTSASSNSTGSLNAPAFWADHWTPSNPNAQYPRFDSADLGENSTFWIRSGTRLYINNASLSYALPRGLADRLKIPNLRFILTGENLWAIINPFDYKDVRQSSLQSYPTLRTISLGVNLTL